MGDGFVKAPCADQKRREKGRTCVSFLLPASENGEVIPGGLEKLEVLLDGDVSGKPRADALGVAICPKPVPSGEVTPPPPRRSRWVEVRVQWVGRPLKIIAYWVAICPFYPTGLSKKLRGAEERPSPWEMDGVKPRRDSTRSSQGEFVGDQRVFTILGLVPPQGN